MANINRFFLTKAGFFQLPPQKNSNWYGLYLFLSQSVEIKVKIVIMGEWVQSYGIYQVDIYLHIDISHRLQE